MTGGVLWLSLDEMGAGAPAVPDVAPAHSHDAVGNLIQQTSISTGATINYTWDYRNRLTPTRS